MLMNDTTKLASIALNRFGYGLQIDGALPSDPVRYLMDQFERFDPSPKALSQRPQTEGQAAKLLEIIRRNRGNRQNSQTDPSARMRESGDRTGTASPNMARLEGLPTDYRNKVREAYALFRSDVARRTNIAVNSDTPMIERLVHFWSNHFSVSVGKPGTPYEAGHHEFSAIRPHVLGKFSDMLKAATLHPAMLIYLDQFQSIGPNSRFQSRRRNRRGQGRGLNENLAREILELHTLGVDGGYDQADVTEFARALTGWTIPGIARIARFSERQDTGAAFVDLAHEPGTRRILGKSYGEKGPRQALAILDDLARHPSTAKFVATKIARHFAGDSPSPKLISRLERDFRETNGNLASLAHTLVNSPELWVESPLKFRQPFEWLVASLRLTGVTGLSDRRISGALNEIGQVPWRAPSPAGYDDLEGSWAGPDAVFRRVELAERLARSAPSENVLERAEKAFPGTLSEHTRLWLSRAESGPQALGLLLVAPEMMRR